jgi:cytochrome c
VLLFRRASGDFLIEVYALSAFLLNQNGVVPPDTRLNETSLPKVRMPNRDGFVGDPRPGRL